MHNPIEVISPEVANLRDNIVSEFEKVFPNGFIKAYYRRGLGKENYISLAIGMIGDKSDQASQIIDNDPMLHKFMIYIHDDDTYTAKLIQGSGFYVNPEPGSYLAMTRHKVPYRQSKGDSKRILKAMKRHFGRLKTELGKIESNLFGRERIKDIYVK